MEFKWFNRPSTFFKSYPDLLKDTRAVSSFLEELEDLHIQIFDSEQSRLQLLLELEKEIRWLKENRQDNPIKFD